MIDFDHTKKVGETYWEHAKWSLSAGLFFLLMVPIAIIHGIFPFLLAGVPDKMMLNWLRKFRERRTRTGQAEEFPE